METSHYNKPKSADPPTSGLSNPLQFWLLLTFGLPSLICSLFTLYLYLSNRIRRHALHNHIVPIIIMTNILLIVTDFSWTLDSLRRPGHILSATPAFCMIWWFLDFTLYNTQTVILAWASIERHILIFHSHMVSTRKQRLVYHYLPPIILFIYLAGFYVGVIFLPPCENEFNFTSVECGPTPCYLNNIYLTLWDFIGHNVLPSLIIAVFSFALLYRIIAQKKRIHQPVQWRKRRRMSIQLLSLSAFYLFFNLPLTIIMEVQLFQTPEPQFSFAAQLYIFFLTYIVSLSLPFVVYFSYLSNDKHRNQRISPARTFITSTNVHMRCNNY